MVILGATLLAVARLTAQSPPACSEGKTALVLSGGGAKGLAHVSVIRALDSLGARPDLVVGTSMGSIVGALYASGYSADAIDSIATVLSPSELFRTSEPRTPRPWQPLTPLLVWVQGEKGLSLRSPAVDEPRANATLSAVLLSGNLLARGDFDSLPIPYRAVATNLATRDPVVLGQGDLAQAVRASVAIPLVFPPEPIDTLLLSDGGLSANIPIEVARQLGATRVIVSDVTGPLHGRTDLAGPLAVAEQLAGFLFQQHPPARLAPGDLYIKVDVVGFANLDFSPRAVEQLQRNGRLAADSVLARAECLPRAPIRQREPPARVGAFTLDGGIPGDEPVLQRVLGTSSGAAVDQRELALQLRRLGELDTYDALWLRPEGEGDSVRLRGLVRRAPPRQAGVTFAYDNDLGGRLGLMYLDRHLLGTSNEASAVAGLSRLKTDLTAGLRRYFGYGRYRFAPAITVRTAEEKIIRYNEEGQELGRPSTRELVFFAGLERELGRWTLAAGGDARFWRDADTSGVGSGGETDRSGGLLVRASGGVGPTQVNAESIISGTFRRVLGELRGTATFGRLSVTPSARFGWGEELPLQNQFPLGGDEGFPGLAVQEIRGDRELFAGLQSAWQVRDQISVLLLLAAGRSANGGPVVGSDGWLSGFRTGIGLDTAIGPVRFEYGVASNGRDQLFVRIGRWF